MASRKAKSISPLIIAGSGRSGTTWVLDAIAYANGLRTVFEPLHPQGVRKARGFAYRYVEDTASEPELAAFLTHIFTGQLRCLWTKYRGVS